MASNLKETAVKTVIVMRARLAETLQKNLATHKKEYAEAMDGYRAQRLELLQGVRDAASTACESNTKDNRQELEDAYYAYSRLDIPKNHAHSYEQAIALMEWETRDEIELSINDFECYVQDNWNWKRAFKASHANYSASL